MDIKKLVALCAFAALGLTAGCATQEGFQQRADAHIGQLESELVASMGKPTRIYNDAQGNRFVEYKRSNEEKDDFSTASYANVMTPLGPAGTMASSKPTPRGGDVFCTLTFKLSPGGTVMSWAKAGNLCVN